MSDVAKGGRGKRAPYTTVMCRVPEPIKAIIEALTAKYRELVDNYDSPDNSELISALTTNSNPDELQQLREEVKSLEINLKLARKKAKEFEQQLADAENQIYHLRNGGAVKILTSKIRELELENYQLKNSKDTVDEKNIISEALIKFIEAQKESYGKNGAQKGKPFDLNTRKWDAFREFMKLFTNL